MRTGYGVPHIFADDLEAMGFGLAWVQSEDWGDVAAVNMIRARGELARHVGPSALADDVTARASFEVAVRTWPLLESATRAVYEGFAAGLRHRVRLHPDDFPEWLDPDITGIDVHAREVQGWSRGDARAFVEALAGRPAAPAPERSAEDGSNAWAFDGSRTASGHAMLLRNPHLSWSAGYYEAHVVVPDVLDFHGDFRIGGAFGIIGGFNRRLGWATTNNYPTLSQVYAFALDPNDAGRYLLDGRSHAPEQRRITVEVLGDDGTLTAESRTTDHTPHGPVIARDDRFMYVLKDPREGEWRRGEQFLAMMQASSFDAWLDVMRLRAHPSSNFIYADADGIIAHLYNARLPLLPHAPTGDSAAVAHTSDEVWSELVPFEALPLYVNPPGGYVQQANDTPDYTNLNVPLGRDTMPANLPAPRLRLRSQLSLELAHDTPLLTLETMLALKHSPRMPAAERLLPDLIGLLGKAALDAEEAAALRALEAWNGTAAADSRGGVVFARWFDRYRAATDSATLWARPWTPDAPLFTPMGIGSPSEAVAAFRETVDALLADGVAPDATWGEVHRVIRGNVDVPVSGCSALLGCFRTLTFSATDDGRRAVTGGDGWIFAVEFGPEAPEAISVLAYGQSDDEDSPHFADQAALFAAGQAKRVPFTRSDVEQAAVRRYRPGQASGSSPAAPSRLR